MTDNTQRYFINVQFNYEGEVYDGDPTDLNELAALEQHSIQESLERYLDDWFNGGIDGFYVKVDAVRKTGD